MSLRNSAVYYYSDVAENNDKELKDSKETIDAKFIAGLKGSSDYSKDIDFKVMNSTINAKTVV